MVRTLLALVLIAAPAAAEIQISLYSGAQIAFDSDVTGNDPTGVGNFDFSVDWEGRSFEPPPYYGIRATWWQGERLGFALDFQHNKVYADDQTLASSGFPILEFTDGLNIVTANMLYRVPNQSRLTPYVGVGAGVSLPWVEVQTTPTATATDGLQFGGFAASALAGVDLELTDRWSVFGELRVNYTQNDVDLDGGGSLDTDIITNTVSVGVSFSF